MGPHKVAYCELYDHHDGTFTLNVKPQEAGRHVLQIKYGGQHVPGKVPFKHVFPTDTYDSTLFYTGK